MTLKNGARALSTTPLDSRLLSVTQLVPNAWNPNEQDAFIYEKEKASISRFGFVAPIIVRELTPDVFQIVDGEHRLRAAIDLGFLYIPCVVIDVSEEEAKQLTIILNETKGSANPEKLRKLLADLRTTVSLGDLTAIMPFSPERMSSLLEGFDWQGEAPKKAESANKWVLRSYRMPIDAAEVLDEAIGKVQASESTGKPIPDWQAIEYLAAEYLGES
jgi:hypothetical protein